MPRILLRRGTAANWTSANPTLAEGEEGYETDTGKRKVGDGSTAWTLLAYAGGGVSVLDDLADVNAPAPTDQYVLTWDNGTGKWIAATPAGGAPTGSAGGDLSGTYPNPTVAATHAGSTHIALSASEPGAVSTTSSGTAGSGTAASKDDHSHDLGFDDATADPAVIGTTADGTATSAARKDHVHATGAGTPSTQAFGDAAAVGTGPAAAMTDHKHAMPSGATITTLSALTAPTSDDLLLVIDDPSGTPVSKKATILAVLGTPPWTVVRKAADEDVSSSTTLQDDDELFFTGSSGTVYEIEMWVIYSSPVGGGTPNFKLIVFEDATARGDIEWIGLTTGSVPQVSRQQFGSGGTLTLYGTATTKRVQRGLGWYTSAGGLMKLQWAQGTSDANATRVHAGSFLRYRAIV